MVTYYYDRTTQPDLYWLGKQIENSEILPSEEYAGANWCQSAGKMCVHWNVELSNEEKEELDNLVANTPYGDSTPNSYTGVVPINILLFSENAPYLEESSTEYTAQCRFAYPGRNLISDLQLCVVIASVSGGWDAAVRLYDVVNNKTIFEKTGIGNTVESIISLDKIDMVSEYPSMYELQVKASEGEVIRICHLLLKPY